MVVELIVMGILGAIFGFATCAILTTGKVSDLYEEIRLLREKVKDE